MNLSLIWTNQGPRAPSIVHLPHKIHSTQAMDQKVATPNTHPLIKTSKQNWKKSQNWPKTWVVTLILIPTNSNPSMVTSNTKMLIMEICKASKKISTISITRKLNKWINISNKHKCTRKLILIIYSKMISNTSTNIITRTAVKMYGTKIGLIIIFLKRIRTSRNRITCGQGVHLKPVCTLTLAITWRRILCLPTRRKTLNHRLLNSQSQLIRN